MRASTRLRISPLLAGGALGMATALSGCSYFADFFPDKQKEYRYSSELPPLEIPPDLLSSGRDESRYSRDETAEQTNADSGSVGSGGDSEAERSDRPSKEGVPAATLAQGSDDVPLIEVEAPFAETWNNVSRALGRMEVEVSDQNRSDGVYYVSYGGETKKYEDRGLWQDIASMFSDGSAKAQDFRLKLEEKGTTTDIFVLDKDGKPVSDGVGLDLLKHLQDKLQNLDKPEPGQAESKDES